MEGCAFKCELKGMGLEWEDLESGTGLCALCEIGDEVGARCALVGTYSPDRSSGHCCKREP